MTGNVKIKWNFTPISVSYSESLTNESLFPPTIIHNIPLSLFESVKYLGIHIDSNLYWSEQTNYILNKASFMLSFLERNLNRYISTRISAIASGSRQDAAMEISIPKILDWNNLPPEVVAAELLDLFKK